MNTVNISEFHNSCVRVNRCKTTILIQYIQANCNNFKSHINNRKTIKQSMVGNNMVSFLSNVFVNKNQW